MLWTNLSTNALPVLLQHIVLTYLATYRCNVVFSKESEPLLFPQSIYEGHPFIFYNNHLLESSDEYVLAALEVPCNAFFIHMAKPEVILDAYGRSFSLASQRYSQRKIIILMTDCQSPTEQRACDIQQLLKHPVFRDLPDVLVILQDDNADFEIITTKFKGRYNSSEPILLDRFYKNLTFQSNSDLFPDKIKNLEGRVLRLTTINYKPYTMWDRVSGGGQAGMHSEGEDSDGTVQIEGTEMKLILEFCAKINCTIRIVPEEEHLWGEIWDDNRTGNGILGTLLKGNADIGLAALYSWHHEYTYLDFSVPQTRTGITCLTPAPRLKAGWLIPALPFSKWLWIAVLISFILSAVSIYAIGKILNQESSLGYATFLVGGIYLLQAPSQELNSPQERQMVAWILIVAMMLANVYGGGLSSIMTIPRFEASIDTVEQLAASGLQWSGTHDAWTFSILTASQPDLVTLRKQFKTRSFEDLVKHSVSRDISYGIERLPGGHFAIGDYITEAALGYLQLMKEDIYWEQVIAMLPKNSAFLVHYNNLIMNIYETGLFAVWETQVSMQYLNNKVQLGVKISNMGHHEADPVKLRPDHVLGVYILWGFGLIVATISFFFEIAIYYCRNSKYNVG